MIRNIACGQKSRTNGGSQKSGNQNGPNLKQILWVLSCKIKKGKSQVIGTGIFILT